MEKVSKDQMVKLQSNITTTINNLDSLNEDVYKLQIDQCLQYEELDALKKDMNESLDSMNKIMEIVNIINSR